ncbi:hypothetical protein CEXT_98351 [Caerostris extrusa]|uniref:Uncharacterized protein n=1 Tax=Caerostris extrusa TaxID=172846 RepID=A0AAV4RH91_CAEEX|nr:hypothetical protein CEXT_98351 [Caerostris extrusa]
MNRETPGKEKEFLRIMENGDPLLGVKLSDKNCAVCSTCWQIRDGYVSRSWTYPHFKYVGKLKSRELWIHVHERLTYNIPWICQQVEQTAQFLSESFTPGE